MSVLNPTHSIQRPDPPVARFVRRLRVGGLFGRYSYSVAVQDEDASITDPGPSRMMILYGENGCGKTTLLRLLFHTLSAAPNRGHRTALAQIPFREFEIVLSDNSSINVTRAEDSGSLTLTETVNRPHEPAVSASFRYDESFEPVDRLELAHEQEQTRLLAALDSLGVDLYYLNDQRELNSDRLPQGGPDNLLVRYSLAAQWGDVPPRLRPRRDATADEVTQSVLRAEESIRRRTLAASQVGQANAQAIYTDVVRRISKSVDATVDPTVLTPDLTARVEQLATRTTPFARLGLISELDVTELVDLLRSAPATTYNIVHAVLEPYLSSIEARLDALDPVRRDVQTLLERLNEFLADKHVAFWLPLGFQVRAKDESGELLVVALLSSGERHLLTIFCNALFAHDRPSIFLIDEPELSLNVRWQRRLVDALFDCTQGSPIQFVFASHSVELLSEHLGSAIELRMG